MSVSVCGCAQCSAMWLAGGNLSSTASAVSSATPDDLVSQSATAIFTTTFSPISNAQGVQYGTQWSGDVRYTFPISLSNYELNYADPTALSGASATTSTQRAAVRDILGGSISTYFNYGSVASIIASNIYEVSATSGVNGAEIRVANSSNTSNAPAYAYLPSSNPAGGDVWIASNYTASLQLPVVGTYGWMTHIHELGHALGLKHAHQSSPYNSALVNSFYDDMEFTVMSYRSYVGQPIQGYANETYGFAQTLMMYDIAALQSMYGADYSTNATATTYTWNPLTGAMSVNGVSQGTPGANRIFLTTWDGGGVDTYDLSNYSTNLQIDLSPGGYSTFSIAQLALLDAYNGTGTLARGNVYNALLFNGDARSYIENAIGGTGNDLIVGNAIANVLSGGSGNDTLYGGFGDDTLIGGSGNDSLDGGQGADAMIGGSGNDTYFVNHTGDTVTEQAGEGIDTVQSEISYTLSANVENLTLTGGAVEARGNELANILTGTDSANSLYGFGGDDTLIGGLGADTMVGGSGNDTYNVDNVGDVVTELAGEGTDLVQSSVTYTLGANVENLTLTGAGSIAGTGNDLSNVLRGNSSNNTLIGLDGNDTLMGEQGADIMIGGMGDDTYYVDNIGDSVVEQPGEGTDWVQSTISYTLGADVENLTIFGAAAFAATGNALANVLIGNENNNVLTGLGGDDTLNGGFGADTMVGGTGNDIYVVDNAGDIVTELSGEGTDLVQSSVSYTLGANVENLTLASGAGSIAGAGNELANVILGNEGNNTLWGYGGNDTLNGGAGNDVIDGGAGFDTAVFAGLRSDYQVIWDYDVVKFIRSGETDTLYNVEQVSFSDGLASIDSFGPAPAIIEAAGATQLVNVGIRSYLRDSGGAGPSLKYQGAAVVAGQFGAGWTAIGAEQVGSGYQVAFKNGSADQYAVWNVDGNGNMLDLPAGILSGTSATLQSLETTFQQDLNGNGQIGLVPVTIESFGSTRLVQLGSQFSLQDSGGAGPSLKYQGAAVVAGQFGAWTAIGAEQVGSGYQIAFKSGDQYAVWNVDGNGNMLNLPAGILSGTSTTLQTLETTFQQDLNGSGQIGLVPTTIESFGTTRLVQLGSEFSLQDSGGAGPSLKYQGAAVVAGQFGAWAAIGAEQVGSGYQIAFKTGDQYAVWNVDGNGNMLDLPAGILSGTSATLQSLETTFQQDLNGNGQIGLVPTTIESFGSTRLVQLGSQFSLQDSGGAGPPLKYQGAAVVAGQFGAWAAIGAEQVGSGYQIAFKTGDQYAVWNVDGNGNMLDLPAGILSGTSATLQSLETTFQQDLNGNGQIGLVPTTIESFGATSLVRIGSQFFLQDGVGAGPSMKYQGAAYVEGQFGAWTAIGAEQVGSGYQAAFKNGSADQYVVWNLDGNGNYTGNATAAVAGSDATLRALETTFQQDLNNSGQIGANGYLAVDQLVQAIAGFAPTPSSQTVTSSEFADVLVPSLVSNSTRPQG
ncbi:MAG: hypothetical protein K9G48_02905 [Reyranella sp.]|nr:hypothetical protein [Reyranella sp.]